MNRHELDANHEPLPGPMDALVVLGKNISEGIGDSPEDIRASRSKLSLESEINAIAAGMLYSTGACRKIIFSTGHTAGPEVPSEARAMKDYMLRHFPDISEEAVILEEESINTKQNAQEVSKIVGKHQFEHVGLLTVGYHLPRSFNEFQRAGVEVEQKFAAEDVLQLRSRRHQELIDRWHQSELVRKETNKERIARLLLKIDPSGRLIDAITSRTRH